MLTKSDYVTVSMVRRHVLTMSVYVTVSMVR